MDNAVKNILFMNKEDKLIASNSLATFAIYSYFEENEEPFYIHKNNDKRNIALASSYGDKYLAILSLRLFNDDPDNLEFNRVKLSVYEIKNLYHDDSNTIL